MSIEQKLTDLTTAINKLTEAIVSGSSPIVNTVLVTKQTPTPTDTPTQAPTLAPAVIPTEVPTPAPTPVPTQPPTLAPTEAPAPLANGMPPPPVFEQPVAPTTDEPMDVNQFNMAVIAEFKRINKIGKSAELNNVIAEYGGNLSSVDAAFRYQILERAKAIV